MIDSYPDAPRAVVRRCWTGPAQLAQGFTPAPRKTKSAIPDVRPGGTSTMVMESPGSNTAADQLEAVLVLVRNGKHKSLYVGDVTDLARTAAKVFRNNGALSVVETWGEDVPDGKLTSFPMAVKLEADETVVFSWIVWPDKETCTSGMEASMKQLDEIYGPEQLQNVPFDGKRMIWGGFETIVEA